MFGNLKPEFMPEGDIKKISRASDTSYLIRALKEAGDEVSRALDSGSDEEVREAIGHYRRALAEVTQTVLGRNAGEKDKIKDLERKLGKVAADLNKGILEGDRAAIRRTLESINLPEEGPYAKGKFHPARKN